MRWHYERKIEDTDTLCCTVSMPMRKPQVREPSTKIAVRMNSRVALNVSVIKHVNNR